MVRHIVLRCAVLGATCLALGLRSASIPPVPADHPRVYLRPADVAALKAAVRTAEFEPRWARVKRQAREHPAAAALVYLVEDDADAGRRAVSEALTDLQASTTCSRWYHPLHVAACVYDWCYPLMGETEKSAFITEFKRLFASTPSGYPANPATGAISTGSTEGEVLTGHLPAGVAIYDEEPEMYHAAAALFFDSFVPVRNAYYPSHTHHQGDSYINRFAYDMFSAWLMRRLGAGTVFSPDQQFVPYSIIYNRRPDGLQFRRGDHFDHLGVYGSKRLIFMLTGTFYEDPHLLHMADTSVASVKPFPAVFEVIFRKPGLKTRPVDSLPWSKYFGSPIGEMAARTGWTMGTDSPVAAAFMRIGEVYFHGHQQRDMGTFQLYFRGPLAVESGIYQGPDTHAGTEHWRDYLHQTLAHNGLLIFDPEEVPVHPSYRRINDGGQIMPNKGYYPRPANLFTTYRLGNVTDWGIGPDPDSPAYNYLAGDITRAYGAKAEHVSRKMLFINTGDPRFPAGFTVLDRVVSRKPEFRKTWLLHTIQEPLVQENQIVVTRDTDGYSGKMVLSSMLPKERLVRKIGGPGRDFWVDAADRNLTAHSHSDAEETGRWRVEVSPRQAERQAFFLNTMVCMRADETTYPAVQPLVTDDASVGGQVLDVAWLFSLAEDPRPRREFTLDVTDQCRLFVADLSPGIWKLVETGGNSPERRLQTTQAHLWLSLPRGTYVLEKQ